MNERLIYRAVALFMSVFTAIGCFEISKYGNNGIGLGIISGLSMLTIGISFINERSK